MKMNIVESDANKFEEAVTKGFAFLESDCGFKCSGLKIVQEDPRDSYVAVKYRSDAFRMDVVWNPLAMFVGIFIRVNGYCLERSKRYLYFEPFVEYVTEGSTKPIIPQIYPRMSVGKIECVMEQRKNIFKNGVLHVVMALSERVEESFWLINSASKSDIEKYQEWYINGAKIGHAHSR